MRTWLSRVVKFGMAAMLAGVTAQAAAPGVAHADWIDCPDKYVCLWGDGNYTGRYIFVPQNDGRTLFTPNIGSFMNDLTTSIWNRTDWRICFYNDINYQGQLLCLDAGGSTPNVGWDANDKISSFQPF